MENASGMIPALRHVLAARRTEAGWSQRAIAAHAASKVGYSQISRFEGGAGTTDVDALVTGYATALRITPREIWQQALELYLRDPEGLVAGTALRGRRAVERLSAP